MENSDLIIAEAVRQAIAATTVLIFADVTAVAGSRVTVLLDGVSVPNVQCINGYAPSIGHHAWLLRQGGKMYAIGKQP